MRAPTKLVQFAVGLPAGQLCYGVGPTAGTVWVQDEAGQLDLVRPDGKDLSSADERAERRAMQLHAATRGGGVPYYTAGAYVEGLEFIEPVERTTRDVARWSGRGRQRGTTPATEVSDTARTRVPFDRTDRVKTDRLWRDLEEAVAA